MTKTFTFYFDPGHGWLQVTLADMLSVGLRTADVSRYSYIKGDRVYLEEDCDATKFLRLYEHVNGYVADVVENANGAFVRNLTRLPDALAAI